MDMQNDLIIELKDMEGDLYRLGNGGHLDNVTDGNMAMLTDVIFWKMPINSTLFKNYDSSNNQWVIEIFNEMRDFKTKPFWSATFGRISDEDWRRKSREGLSIPSSVFST